jgi:hypothetical protein
MKRLMTVLVICTIVCLTLPLFGQKVVRYNFSHLSEPSNESSLKTITEINAPSSAFLRLFLEGTRLGNESYILLEGTDGAKQQLRNQDLVNWNFSSAYFNGDRVKISLYSAKGEKNQVVVRGIKASDTDAQNSLIKVSGGKTTLSSQSAVSTSNIDYSLLPHAAAVGRFTNGSNSYGTGWIAANGAIVTSKRIAYDYVLMGDYDIIEFNVPSSDAYGSVRHPGPEDQYPINQSKWVQDIVTFDFKRKHHFDINKEDDYGDWHTTWAIVEALPNSTGLRPGERQQQYFQVAANPGSFTIEAQNNIFVDVFHYGEITTDLVYGDQYRVLKRHVTTLRSPEEYLDLGGRDRDDFVLYSLDNGDITLSDSDAGAPITYNQFNIAIGVHNDFFRWAPAVGVGFRNDDLMNSLNDFLDTDMTYVDQSSFVESGTGAIDKPYLSIVEGIEHAEISGVVNIAKGSYGETMTIEKAVTLTAPVGKVIIGEEALSTRQATLPQGMEDDGEMTNLQNPTEDEVMVLSATASPNPFISNLILNYTLPRPAQVRVNVYDKVGNMIRSLVDEAQVKGSHAVTWDGNNHAGRQVTPGIYVMHVETEQGSLAVKVIKN